MPSQPEDQGDYRKRLVQELGQQKLLPRNQAMIIHEGIEEHVYVVGQLAIKLEALGVGKLLLGRLRSNRFDPDSLDPPPTGKERKLLARREVDETLYRIQEHLGQIAALEQLEPDLQRSADKDRARLERMGQADKKRAEHIKQQRQAREKEDKGR